MNITNLMIGLVLMSGVIYGMSGFYMDAATNNNLVIDETLETFKHLNSTNTISQNMENTIVQSLQNIPVLGYLAIVTVQGMAALTYAFELPGLFFSMASDLTNFIGLPGWFPIMIQTVVILILIFVALGAYLKWKV